MAPFRTVLFLASVWITLASSVAGLELETSARLYREITTPSSAIVAWVTNPGGRITLVWSAGKANVKIVQRKVGNKVFTVWGRATLRRKFIDKAAVLPRGLQNLRDPLAGRRMTLVTYLPRSLSSPEE